MLILIQLEVSRSASFSDLPYDDVSIVSPNNVMFDLFFNSSFQLSCLTILLTK